MWPKWSSVFQESASLSQESIDQLSGNNQVKTRFFHSECHLFHCPMSKKIFTLTYPRNQPLTSLLGQWHPRSPPTHLAARYYLKCFNSREQFTLKTLYLWLCDQKFCFRHPALKNLLPFPLLEDLIGQTSQSMVKTTRLNFARVGGLVLSAEAIPNE